MSTVGEILLVEDHRDIAEMIGAYLENQGYIVDYAADGISGLQLGAKNDYDAIVLDLMLPGLDGLDVCRRLRDHGRSNVPVLMLTARDTLDDKLAGFSHGADDYLVKPFDIEELDARLRALIRRNKSAASTASMTVADLHFDLQTMKVTRAGQRLSLTPIGMRILQVLMRESPKVVHRRAIEREIWGDLPPNSDALRSHMYTLRKSVDKPFPSRLIHTMHSAGFRLADES
jgi:DNA-binding response OmpR family regulator